MKHYGIRYILFWFTDLEQTAIFAKETNPLVINNLRGALRWDLKIAHMFLNDESLITHDIFKDRYDNVS